MGCGTCLCEVGQVHCSAGRRDGIPLSVVRHLPVCLELRRRGVVRLSHCLFRQRGAVACTLRGASNVAYDLYDDPAFVDDLLSFITEATIRRRRACRKLAGRPLLDSMFYFADDAIEWLSPSMDEQFVLPHHKRMVDEFRGEKNLIHLCGDPAHLFPTIVEHLGISVFDLGFPTDMGEARRQLGPDITLIGNIAPSLLLSGPPAAIREAVRQLCSSGVMEGGRFILHDGNNCVPLTPVAHFREMYEAGKKFGLYHR